MLLLPLPANRTLLSLRLKSLALVTLVGVSSLPLTGRSEEAAPPAPSFAVPPLPQPPATPAEDSQVLTPSAPAAEKAPMGELPIPPAPEPRSEASGPVPVPYAADKPFPAAPVLIPPAPQNAGDEEWSVAITPLEKKSLPPLIANYEKVYRAIPYRRAEYLANPSYRHDTTVEVLFGQMRSMVINRTDTPERVVNPRPQFTQPYPISKGELYSYWPLLQYSYPLPLLSPIE